MGRPPTLVAPRAGCTFYGRVKALLLGETDATRPVAERLRALGHEPTPSGVDRARCSAELAAAGDVLVVLFAGDADVETAVLELRAPDAIARAPIFVVT